MYSSPARWPGGLQPCRAGCVRQGAVPGAPFGRREAVLGRPWSCSLSPNRPSRLNRPNRPNQLGWPGAFARHAGVGSGGRVASASTPSLLGAAAWSGAGRRTVSRELSRAQGRARNRQAAPCRKGKGAQGTPDTQGTAQSASAREQPARAACASRLSGWKRTWSDGMPCRLRWHGEHPSLLPAEALAAKPSSLASGQSSRCACGCIRRAQLS